MTEQNNTTHVNDESSHSKRRKAIVQSSKTKASPRAIRGSGSEYQAQTVKKATSAPLVNHKRDPHIFIKIQERAYSLFQASGFKHGHDLEHWLEAEREILQERPHRGGYAGVEQE